MDEELTFSEYFTVPMIELVNHPDYSQEAYMMVIEISKMTTAQLEKLNTYREAKANG